MEQWRAHHRERALQMIDAVAAGPPTVAPPQLPSDARAESELSGVEVDPDEILDRRVNLDTA
eukprot:393318-Pyramimonas_sp.AAC.1